MKGKNELRLNQGSLNEAVEFYLNSMMFKDAIKVTDVIFTTSSGVAEFIVKLQPQDATAESIGVGL